MAEYDSGGNASWDSPPERKPKSSKSLRNLFAPASKVVPVVEERRLRRNSATWKSSRQRPSSQPDLKTLDEDPPRRARRGRRASLFGSMHQGEDGLYHNRDAATTTNYHDRDVAMNLSSLRVVVDV